MEEKRGISGYGLKMIAVITMLIDHTAASVLDRMLRQMPAWGPINGTNWVSWNTFYIVLRGIGRMAFPIYCFLLVEGFLYTRSRAKYALRLFVFALISEIPFDLALRGSLFDISYNNVFFTLFLGLLTIMAADYIREKLPLEGDTSRALSGRTISRYLLTAVALFAGCVLAELVLRCDYGATGVLAIFVLYVWRERRLMGFTIAVVVLGLLAGILEFLALLMLIPMYFYNGTRGKQVKYFFYAFYPAHLLILALICCGIGL